MTSCSPSSPGRSAAGCWSAATGCPMPTHAPCVPVSRRRPGGAAATGNRLSAYLLGLPVSEADPWNRLRAVRTAMDRNKAAGPLRGAGAVAVLADQLPSLAHRFGAPLAGSAARMLFDVLVTSVPLPRSALSLGAARCGPSIRWRRWPGAILAVALSTYGGRVQIGLVADGKALPGPGAAGPRASEDELRELLALMPADQGARLRTVAYRCRTNFFVQVRTWWCSRS